MQPEQSFPNTDLLWSQLCLLNSLLAPHYLWGPVQTQEHPHICPLIKE